MYLGYLRKAEYFCRSNGTHLDKLDEEGLFAFACTLHPSRSVLHQARAALRILFVSRPHFQRPRARRIEPSREDTTA